MEGQDLSNKKRSQSRIIDSASMLFVILSAAMLFAADARVSYVLALPIAFNLFVAVLSFVMVCRDSHLRRSVSRTQAFLCPLLFYSIIAVIALRLHNPAVPIDTAAKAVDTLFHAIKDLGASAVLSVYLALVVPFASLLSLKTYRGSNLLYDFVVLGQPKNRRVEERKIVTHPSLTKSFSGFWSEFAIGFAGQAGGSILVRYLAIVYSLAFLSIPLLSYFKVEPVTPLAIPDVNLAYWTFMITFVASAVWAFYMNRVCGNPIVEKFFLKLFYSFFSLSALATVFSSERLQYLTFILPPITLIGITICMLSLEKQVLRLIGLPKPKKFFLFVVGVVMVAVPSAFLTISPWANNTFYVIYLWSGSAVGLAIWGYLVASRVKAKHKLLASFFTFLCFETAFMIRFAGLSFRTSSFFAIWLILLVIGFLATLFWRRSEPISFCLIALAWIANELLSQNWFYSLILLQGLAIGNTIRSERECHR